MAKSKNVTPRQRYKINAKQVSLISEEELLGGRAPRMAEIERAIALLLRGAAFTEQSEDYADCITKVCLTNGLRLGLLRAASVLVFKNARADTVWDAAEYILVPLLTGLCEGKRETGNFMGTGMGGSDGREFLHELDRDEGEPLSRIIKAIARHCPQVLHGNPECDND